MSKSLAERVDEMETQFKRLQNCAHAVVDNWDNSTLAQHVQNLEEMLDEIEGV
jgi:site-specific recombinase